MRQYIGFEVIRQKDHFLLKCSLFIVCLQSQSVVQIYSDYHQPLGSKSHSHYWSETNLLLQLHMFYCPCLFIIVIW